MAGAGALRADNLPSSRSPDGNVKSKRALLLANLR